MYVAPPVAEYPVAHQLVGQRERHDDYAQEEVGHGQAGYEPVLHVLQRLLGHDGYDDQHVAHHHDDHEHDDHHGGDHYLRDRVRGWVHGLENVVRPVGVDRAVGAVQVTGAVPVDQQPVLVPVDREHHARQVGQVLGRVQRFHFRGGRSAAAGTRAADSMRRPPATRTVVGGGGRRARRGRRAVANSRRISSTCAGPAVVAAAAFSGSPSTGQNS